MYNAIDGSYTSPAGFYTKLVRNTTDGTYTERDRTGLVFSYAAPDIRSTAPMTRMTDRAGNTMQFLYNQRSQLDRVIDTLGRTIQYFYNERRQLREVRDFLNRSLVFTYSVNGDLETVRSPVVTGTPTGNDFAVGKTIFYVYRSDATDARLNHNLLFITAPEQVGGGAGGARRTITYVETPGVHLDRVQTQVLGGTNGTNVPAGGTIAYAYQILVTPPPPVGDVTTEAFQTTATDRNGNVTEYRTNRQGNLLRRTERTNRNLRPDEPDYVTTYQYNADYEMTQQTLPQGNSAVFTYDVNNADRLQKGNLLGTTRSPDAARSGDQTALTAYSSYEPIYSQVRTATDPRGADGNYRPPIPLLDEPYPNFVRYTTAFFYDYEEACSISDIAAWTGRTPQDVQDRLNAADMCQGTPLGDLNGDGVTNQVAGNIVWAVNPQVNLLAGSNQALVEGALQETRQATGGTATTVSAAVTWTTNWSGYGVQILSGAGAGQLRAIQSNTSNTLTVSVPWTTIPGTTSTFAIIAASTVQPGLEVYSYNQFSQRTKTVDPEGNVHTADFYPENDPNGDGIIDNPTGNTTTGGYLKQSNGDKDPGANRNSKMNPAATTLRRFFQYDAVGNTTLEYDGRGITTRYAVNQLNQVTQITRAALPPAPLPFTPDPGEPLALNTFQYLERFFYDYNDNMVLHQVEDRGNTSGVDGNPLAGDLPTYITNADPVGGPAYVDTATRYDLLDRPVETAREVSGGAVPEFLRTKTRYDPNGNGVLTILPAGNASGSIYDERDLLFQSISGVHSPPLLTQLAAGDPTTYNTRGGLPSTRVLHYDSNRNLIESVDADDTDGSVFNDSKRPTGVTTSASGTSLQDTGRTWTTDQWKGRTVYILTGPGVTQTQTIVSNTANTLTLDKGWTIAPGSGAQYVIRGDRTRTFYDGFDRPTSTVSSVRTQTVTQYDPAGNVVRGSTFGPSSGLSPVDDGAETLAGPFSQLGVIQAGNLVSANLLAATESMHDERNRVFQTDRVLFVNTIPLGVCPRIRPRGPFGRPSCPLDRSLAIFRIF